MYLSILNHKIHTEMSTNEIDIKELLANGHMDVINLMIGCKLFDIDISSIANETVRVETLNVLIDKQLVKNPTVELIITEFYFDLIKLLLEKKLIKDINQIFIVKGFNSFSLLTFMAAYGRWDSVKLLIEQGANVNHQEKYEYTALAYAISFKQTDTVKLLINAGADVSLKDRYNSDALHYAKQTKMPELIKIIEDAMNKSTEYTCRDTDGKVYPELSPKRNICKAIFRVNSDKMPETKTVEITTMNAIGKIWCDDKWIDHELLNINLYDIQIPTDDSKVEYHVLLNGTTETYVRFPPIISVGTDQLGNIYRNF